MLALVACEESQAVTIELRKLGIDAFSCDVKPCSGGFPEWHIQEDVLKVLHFNWDLVIAHPPCTYLTNAAARHLWGNGELNVSRYEKGLAARSFFMEFFNCDCPRVAIENPVPSKIFELPKYDQIIQPYYFGDPYTKRTCLWLRGLPPLVATKLVQPIATWCPSGTYTRTRDERFKGQFTTNRAEMRSKTFQGIASAMAAQWSNIADVPRQLSFFD